MTDQEMYTLAETAAILRISKRSLQTRKASHQLPLIKRAGSRVLVPRLWLSAWLAGAELERIETSDGVIVRPVGEERAMVP